MDIWNIIKKHPAMAIFCVCVGYAGGIGTYKYLSVFLSTDVVLKNSYIYKSEIDKTHVPIEQYNLLRDEYRDIKLDIKNNYISLDVHSYVLNDLALVRDNLRKLREENITLIEYKSKSVAESCKQTASEIKSILNHQNKVEQNIAKLVSVYLPSGSQIKNDNRIKGDLLKAEEQRKYSEQLNLQLEELYKQRQRCLG
ncbi:hypothetical protein [Vibrio owensii]|uniref:hypothetical protein n=1 Tax=Vibrio owensii TaxID=696485 RepID=UPI0018F16D32|nr:hypothetical protein [Vibrio owensii]